MEKVKDFYYYKAKREKYPARSVYKLEEIDRKYRLIKKGKRILDMGAAPGSWSKYCCSRVGDKGLVVAVDRGKVKIGEYNNMIFIQQDVFSMDVARLKELTPFFDIVLSDLAPATTGIRNADQAKSLELAIRAFEIADQALAPGGHFVCKIFQGPDVKINLLDKIRRSFEWVKTVKPKSTRKESFELYIVALNKINA